MTQYFYSLLRTVFWIAAGTLLAGLPAQAQEDDAAAEQRYQVELLLFRHIDQSRTTAEIARRTERGMDDVLDQRLAKLGADDSSRTAVTWQSVAENDRLLNNEASKLRNLQAYELLNHLAWTQTAADVAVADVIPLDRLGVSLGTAVGSVSVFKKRYLHLAVDIRLGFDGRGTPQNLFSSITGADTSLQAGINDSRRVRLGQPVYFDQPQFGVIALITEVASN